MDSIKEWAAMICSISIGSVFTVFLIPDGKLKKFAETVISLVFLLLLISFVTDIDINEIRKKAEDLNSADEFEIIDSASFYTEKTKEYTEQFIYDEISEICDGEFSVNAEILCDDDNVFVLDGIIITVDKKDAMKINEIKNKVGVSTGIEPEVMVLY